MHPKKRDEPNIFANKVFAGHHTQVSRQIVFASLEANVFFTVFMAKR